MTVNMPKVNEVGQFSRDSSSECEIFTGCKNSPHDFSEPELKNLFMVLLKPVIKQFIKHIASTRILQDKTLSDRLLEHSDTFMRHREDLTRRVFLKKGITLVLNVGRKQARDKEDETNMAEN